MHTEGVCMTHSVFIIRGEENASALPAEDAVASHACLLNDYIPKVWHCTPHWKINLKRNYTKNGGCDVVMSFYTDVIYFLQ